jgi:transcriptional regulator with XRE-family HTH domain
MREPRPLPKRRATAEDAAIGQKLRALRLHGGLSQSQLADRVGVSFQQLQKYEKGDNRISAGRLLALAAALGVPVTAFYGVITARGREGAFAYLRTKGAVRLVRAYAAIPERSAKATLVTLAEALARGRAV